MQSGCAEGLRMRLAVTAAYQDWTAVRMCQFNIDSPSTGSSRLNIRIRRK